MRAVTTRLSRGPRWTGMAVAMGSLLAVYGSWQVFRWTPGHRAIVGDVFFYPFVIVAGSAAWRARRRCSASPHLQSAWRLIAAAMLLALGGEISQTVYEALHRKPFPSAADGFFLSFYVLMLWGLTRFAVGRRSPSERVRLALDLAVMAIGSSAVVLYVVLGPTAVAGSPSLLEGVFSIAYPVGDMVLLVGLASVVVRAADQSARRAMQFIALGLLMYVAGDVIYGYMSLHSSYHGGDPVDTFWVAAIALWAVAAAAQTPAAARAGRQIEPGRRRPSWAPYLATALGFGLLIVVLRDRPFFPDMSLAITAVVLAILVSVRQFLAERELLRTQGQLSYQSLHDALTGLPNRVLVFDRAEQMLARSHRQSLPAAALCLDVDGFKQVNDGFGHAAGDELLQVVCKRMLAAIRDSDTVGRLSGDEFIVLVDQSAGDATPELVAERLLEVLRHPIELKAAGGRFAVVTASIGIAYGRQASAEQLLRDADRALHEAKAAGKDRIVVFDSTMQTAAQDLSELRLQLEHALAAEQFFLLYQPIIDLVDERMIGVEALIRWAQPERGLVPPAAFIALAEQSGQIVPIGRWVLATACEQAAMWQRQGHSLGMSINVSARQLELDTLIDDVGHALRMSRLDPASLTLEITETALMRDVPAAARRLRSLKMLGVRIAIDDFGTGYSSLAYLRQFPADVLKIDRSFVSGIAASRESSDALIHTLVQLGKTLGIRTLAEGIEDRAQLQRLQRERCDLGQGFLFARPLTAAEIGERLDAAHRSGRAALRSRAQSGRVAPSHA